MMTQVQRERVAGMVDVAAIVKRYMTNTEHKRLEEEQGVADEVYDLMYAHTHSIAGKACVTQMHDIGHSRRMINHCERLIAIDEIWDGVGGRAGDDSKDIADMPPLICRPYYTRYYTSHEQISLSRPMSFPHQIPLVQAHYRPPLVQAHYRPPPVQAHYRNREIPLGFYDPAIEILPWVGIL
jgi:hypothetical protein